MDRASFIVLHAGSKAPPPTMKVAYSSHLPSCMSRTADLGQQEQLSDLQLGQVPVTHWIHDSLQPRVKAAAGVSLDGVHNPLLTLSLCAASLESLRCCRIAGSPDNSALHVPHLLSRCTHRVDQKSLLSQFRKLQNNLSVNSKALWQVR